MRRASSTATPTAAATGSRRRSPSGTASRSRRSCVGAGADGCIDMLSQAILEPGDEVVCGWPSFPSYVIYASKLGAVPRMVPLADHRYDLDALLAAVTPRTKIVYVCHPNNPTGTMSTTDELDAFFERVPEHVLTVVDQAYFEYIDRPDYPDAIARYFRDGRRVAVLRTFSKIYGLAGQRVGYAVAPRSVCAAMTKVRRPFDVTSPAQAAAVASIGDDAELGRRRAANTAGLARLEAILRGAQARARARRSRTSSTPTAAATRTSCSSGCLREGVIVRPCGGFGVADGDPGLRRNARRAGLLRRRARPRPPARRARDRRSRISYAASVVIDAPPPVRDAPRRRELPSAVLRHARIGSRDVDGDDRAHGRRHRPHALALVGERALRRRRSCRRSWSASSPGRCSTASRARG